MASANASAATLEYAGSSTLRYEDGGPERNRLRVIIHEDRVDFVEFTPGSAYLKGQIPPQCVREPDSYWQAERVTCPVTDHSIRVSTGALRDELLVATAYLFEGAPSKRMFIRTGPDRDEVNLAQDDLMRFFHLDLGSGNDRFDHPGRPMLFGLTAFVDGGDGNDVLDNTHGESAISGGAGDDRLWALRHNPGVHTVSGGPGDDVVFLEALSAVSVDRSGGEERLPLTITAIGGSGRDRLDLRRYLEPAATIQADGSPSSGDPGIQSRDEFTTRVMPSFEVLYGGKSNDLLIGPPTRGGTLVGLEGDDQLVGGRENDILAGGTGADLLNGNAGRDRLSGQDGGDSLFGGPGADRLFGNGGQDLFFGEGGPDSLYAHDGERDSVIGCGGHKRDYARIDQRDPKPSGCPVVVK